ncbi:NADH-quinone oxidoreductase subunit NuoH [Deltaproteobacteria bacterium OttesenSCG-928-K17]|nr:NADH-quinone oxidoreductase subunit NuoH [Deltaproteobacteria bacterium OttesenSCG-928-K17]
MDISLLNVIKLVLALTGIILLLIANSVVMVWLERKVAGYVQRRPGPFVVGPHGILQTIADTVKLLGKQIVVPGSSDRLLFFAGPVLCMFPMFLIFLAIPYGPWLTGLDINLGILLILAFAGLEGLAVLAGGWASNNKYSLIGAARCVSQSVAYEIPLLLAMLALAFMTGSLNLTTITEGQAGWVWNWNIFKQPLAFLIFIITCFGETNRAPFDLPEGESELTGGYHTEYSGMGFALFFMAEYTSMMLVSFLVAVLFLGGSNGPVLNGIWWTFIKMGAFMTFMIWVRWTFPRVRFDQLLNICWKWLLPLGLLNLWLTAIVIKVF